MPLYDFECHNVTCKHTLIDTFIPLSAHVDPKWCEPACPKCSAPMTQIFHTVGVIWKGSCPPGLEIKRGHIMEQAIHDSEQPFESRMEIEEGLGLAAEEEKKRGLTPGSITRGTQMPSKEGVEQRKAAAKKRGQEAKAMRKSALTPKG